MIRENKYILIVSILLMWVCGITFSSCDDDKITGDAPKVLFQVDAISADLNKATNPLLISVVNSEVGLKSVNVYVLKAGDLEEQLIDPAVSFKNPNSHSVSVAPVYTEDMIAFKVVAVDANGQISEGILPINVVALRDPPKVVFNDGIYTIDYVEGTPMPVLKFKVTSEEDITSIVLHEVVDRVQTVLYSISGDDIESGTRSFELDLADLNFQFLLKTTALKVTVVAGPADNPKRKVETLLVNYIELPPAIVTFDQTEDPIHVTELKPLTISGKITAESKIKEIRFYKMEVEGEDPIEYTDKAIIFDPMVSSYDFTFNIPSATPDVKGILVKVIDGLGKSTAVLKNVAVKELVPAPTIVVTQDEAYFNGLTIDSKFNLSGTITTLGELEAAKVIATYAAPDNAETTVETIISISATELQTLNFNVPLDASSNLLYVTVYARDTGGKITEIERIRTHVGYTYHYLRVTGSGNGSIAEGILPYFSAALKKTLSYEEGYTNRDLVNIGFSTFSSGTRMAANSYSSMVTGKFAHPTYPLNSWTNPIGVNVNIKYAANIKRSNFDATTIDMMNNETPGTTNPTLHITTNGINTASMDDVAIFMRPKIDGVEKRVVLCVDKFEEPVTDPHSAAFYIKVKIEK